VGDICERSLRGAGHRCGTTAPAGGVALLLALLALLLLPLYPRGEGPGVRGQR
jgi:hypothetical protein